jgi:hypothetical protein
VLCLGVIQLQERKEKYHKTFCIINGDTRGLKEVENNNAAFCNTLLQQTKLPTNTTTADDDDEPQKNRTDRQTDRLFEGSRAMLVV